MAVVETLIFLEYAEDAAALLGAGELSSTAKIISLAPEVNAFLAARDIPYVLFEKYFDTQAVVSPWRSERERIRRFMARADEVAGTIDPRFATECTPFADYNYFWILLCDVVKVKLLELESVLQAEQPQRVVCYKTQSLPIERGLYFSPEESLVPQLLALPALRKRYHYELTSSASCRSISLTDAAPSPIVSRVKSMMRNAAGLLRAWLRQCLAWRDRKNILYLQTQRTLRAARFSFIKQGFKLHSIVMESWRERFSSPLALYVQTDILAAALRHDREIKELFTVGGICYLDIIWPRLCYFIERLDVLFQHQQYCIERLTTERIEGLVIDSCNNTSYFLMPQLIRICRQRAIPVFCWMHGGHAVVDQPVMEDSDLRLADYLFSWGDALSNHFSGKKDVQAKFLTVGTPLVKKHALRPSAPGKKRVVYVLRDFWDVGRIFGWADPDYSNGCYWEMTTRIIDVLVQFADRYEIIIKLAQGGRIKSAFAEHLRTIGQDGRIRLSFTEIGFDEILRTADVYVFDWISTTFYQAALTPGSIFIYSRLQMFPEVLTSAGKRAWIFDEFADFRHGLEGFLEQGKFALGSKENDEFAQRFLNRDSGQPSTTAAAAEVWRRLEDGL